MPKQFKNYTRFDGGLNTKTNSRSINDNELSDIKNAIVDEFGQIKSCGFAVDNDTDYDDPDVTAMQPGYGLFQGKFDYNSGGTNTPTIRTFIADADDVSAGKVLIDIRDDGVWSTGQIDLGSNTSTNQGKVIYHIADGALRACDSNVDNTSTSVKYYGYLNLTNRWLDGNLSSQTPGGFSGTNGWQSEDVKLSKPTRGVCGLYIRDTCTLGSTDTLLVAINASAFPSELDTELDSGTYSAVSPSSGNYDTVSSRTDGRNLVTDASGVSWSSGMAYTIYPPAGTGFNLDFTLSSGGSWTAGDYEFGTTFLYDGNQESLIYKLSGDLTVYANNKIECIVQATESLSSVRYANRITGGRIYTRIKDSDGTWVLFGEINFRQGAKPSLDGEYTYWTLEYYSSPFIRSTFESSGENLDTYDSINGYSPDSEFISLGEDGEKYQTSAVSNRRVFIANVKYTNGEGVLVHKPDTLMYSEINRFDTFTPFNFIDIGVNDGEGFVKIIDYADRLLAFKEKTLYIVNIGGGSDTQWFLESEHSNMGVLHHESVVKTEFGIAWVNKNGLFFYDGSQIFQLQKKILESTWESFVNTDTMIGFEPVNKHLVVIRDADNESDDNGDAYIYSFLTKSFTFVKDLIVGDNKTNVITDLYNKMTIGTSTDEIKSYDGQPDASTGFDITMKDDDFNLPNIVKKIYGITIEYNSSANNTTAIKYYYINNSGDLVSVEDGSGLSSADIATSTGAWNINRYTFNTPLSVSSFKLRLDLDGDSLQYINNVGIEYRPIYKRIT